MASPRLILVLLFAVCFSLAGGLAARLDEWGGDRRRSGSLLTVLLGDSRRMFANHFFTKADVYFHSGYYPSIFDNRDAHQTPHMAEDAGAVEGRNTGDEFGFLGPPRDWIDRFSRHFHPTQHTHLDQGGAAEGKACKTCGHAHGAGKGHDHQPVPAKHAGLEREMLPWLRIAAELDPHRVETYTVSAYWLRSRMGKVAEAEQFLREGLRANPDSHEIFFELGRVALENRNDPPRARNLWEAALRKWERFEAGKPDPDRFPLQQILMHLAKLEDREGNRPLAISYLERLKGASPNPGAIQELIDELKARPAPPPAASKPTS